MSEKILEIAALLEQMSVTGERNAIIYVSCLQELRAIAKELEGRADDGATLSKQIFRPGD